MPFEMPWVKRYREKIEARPGCMEAREYARKTKLLDGELQRICKRVAQQRAFKQYDYSNVLGVLQEHTKRTAPPAASVFHSNLTPLLEELRDRIRELDPTGYQSPTEVEQILRWTLDQYQAVMSHYERFVDVCFSE